MGAPVNTGLAGRFGRWCASWTPTNIAKSYLEDDKRVLDQVDSSGAFTFYIEYLADNSPDITARIKDNVPGAGWLMKGSEKEIQRGIYLHIAAHLVKQYLGNRRSVPFNQIIVEIAKGLTNTARTKINANSGDWSFYLMAQEMLETFPLLGSINSIIEALAAKLKDIHAALNAPLDYDPNDKLVSTVLMLNAKFINYAKQEIKSYPVEDIKEEYQTVFQALAPALADDPAFSFLWTNLTNRLPSLVYEEVTYLRKLLYAANDEDLIAKLKADFKEVYEAGKGNPETLAQLILWRYFRPILYSKQIPEFLRSFVKEKLESILASKLVRHRAEIEAFLNPAPQAQAVIREEAPAGALHRAPAWYDRYLPESFAASYRQADTAYLNELNPDFVALVNDVGLKLPVFSALKNLFGANANAIQQAIFIHFIASLCRTIYKDNKGPFTVEKITHDVTFYFHKYLIDTLRINPPVTEKSFYEPTKAFLVGICPELGDVPYIVEFGSKIIHEIYLSNEMPAVYDSEDKLVESVAKFTEKFLAFGKKELKTLSDHIEDRSFKTLAKHILPPFAEHASFSAFWDHIEARIPSLLQLVLNHLRALLHPANDEDLIVKLKADFKAQWQAVPNDFPRLSENLVNRYLSPLFDSPFIPATFKPMIKSKVVEVLASKLQQNIIKIEDALEIRKAPPVLPVHVAAPAAGPSFFDRYTPQAIAKSYKEENETYLRDLIGSDKLITLVKNLSHKVPNLTNFAPDFVKTMINGSAIELHEGIFVYLVANLCKSIYEGKEKPTTETQVIQDIANYLAHSIKTSFDKADTTRDLQADDFKVQADLLIKNLSPELGDIPYAIDPVAKLLYEFYLFSRVKPAVSENDPLNETVANYNQDVVNSIKEIAADVKNNEYLNQIDRNLGSIVETLIRNLSGNPIFKGIWAFIEKQIPSLMQMEVAYLKTLFDAQSNRDLFIKFGLDFSRIWKANRKDFNALTRALLARYGDPILNSNLIPASFKTLIVPFIEEKLKTQLEKHQAKIDAYVTAFDLEKEVMLNDPLRPFEKEARQVVKALTKRFYPSLAKKLPSEITKELGASLMEESLYHVFGRLQMKFGARSFKELESRIIGYTHQKLSVLVRGAEIEESIYMRLSEELINDAAPGINAVTYAAKAELAEYLRTLVEIVQVKEPKSLGFGELDREMKPFLYSIVDFILKKALEKPRDIIKELVIEPDDLRNEETLKIARETLYKHLANGVAQVFGEGKLHSGMRMLLALFSRYGNDKTQLKAGFAEWVSRFEFNPKKIISISEEVRATELNSLLEKTPASLRSYFNDLLNTWSGGDVEIKSSLCRHILLNLQLERALDDLTPLLVSAEKMDKEMGASVMKMLLPAISPERYPDLFDNLTDLSSSPLLRLLGQIPEKLSQFSETDIASLEVPQIHPGATILSKISTLTDAISESAEESQFSIGKKLAAFFVEIGASHLIVNNKNDINLLIANLAEHNFLTFSDEQLSEYAKDLIKTLCPVLQAFSPESEEMVVKLLKIAKTKIPSNDLKVAKKGIHDILFNPEDRSDHHIYDVNRYIEQIDTAVYAFAGLILKWTRAYGEKNLPASLKQIVKVEGPLLKHSQEVIAAILMKAILNFLRKVEEVNPGPKNTLLGRSLYVIIKTIVTKLPDIKEGNFKDLAEALWGLFDIDKDVPFDLSYVRREFLPKQLMEYSQSIRKYIDVMDINAKELANLFNKNSLPEFLRVFGTVWVRDFIPHFLSQNTEELSKVFLSEINSFFEANVLQEGDSSFIADAIKELLKKREGNVMDNVYAFAGLYAAAYMLKFTNNVFKKKKIDGLANEIARGAVSKVAAYYSKVVEAKGRRPHAHLMSAEELKNGLGALFSDGMPINGAEMNDGQKAYYGRLTNMLEKAGEIDNPEEMPMIDFLQGSLHNLLTNKLLPSALNSIVKSVGSRKTINKGLLTLIQTVTQNLKSNWDEQEDEYLDTLCKLDDLNYRLHGNEIVDEIKELIKKAKTEYGADWAQVKDILDCANAAVLNHVALENLLSHVVKKIKPFISFDVSLLDDLKIDLAKLKDFKVAEDNKDEYAELKRAIDNKFNSLLDYAKTHSIELAEQVKNLKSLVDKYQELNKIKDDIQSRLDPLRKLAESQDEALVGDLAKLRDAIIHLVPKKFVADLLKIEAFNDMTSNQLGVLYTQLMNGKKFEDWINLGSEIMMKTLIPGGDYKNGHYGPIKPDEPLMVKHGDEVYSEAEARADEKNIIDGFAEVSVNGTNKAILHKIKTYIRDLSMKIGQYLIKWFGVRVIPLRKAYTAITTIISFILEPLFYAISYIFAPVIKSIERKVARREIEPHMRGFHADYNQNAILLLIEDLVALLTNGKADDNQKLQDNHAGV